LEIGDLVIGEMMGAYTAATATDLNSLNKATIIVLNEVKQEAESILFAKLKHSDKETTVNTSRIIH